MTKQARAPRQNLYRVIFRGREFLGTWDEWHSKVVAPDPLTAVHRTLDVLDLAADSLSGCAVTLIQEETRATEGKVFEVARRSRAFGGRGGWIDEPGERVEPDKPRKTPLL